MYPDMAISTSPHLFTKQSNQKPSVHWLIPIVISFIYGPWAQSISDNIWSKVAGLPGKSLKETKNSVEEVQNAIIYTCWTTGERKVMAYYASIWANQVK